MNMSLQPTRGGRPSAACSTPAVNFLSVGHRQLSAPLLLEVEMLSDLSDRLLDCAWTVVAGVSMKSSFGEVVRSMTWARSGWITDLLRIHQYHGGRREGARLVTADFRLSQSSLCILKLKL